MIMPIRLLKIQMIELSRITNCLIWVLVAPKAILKAISLFLEVISAIRIFIMPIPPRIEQMLTARYAKY